DLLGGGRVSDQIAESAVLGLLKPLLEDPSVLKIGHGIKHELVLMQQRDIEIASLDDTLLISYVLDAGQSAHGIDALSLRYLDYESKRLADLTGGGRKAIPFEFVDIALAAAFAGESADLTLRLWRVLKPRLIAEGLVSTYERLERPMVPVLGRMEQRGITVDRQILSRLSGELAQSAAALESEIQQLAGESFNPGSPRQLGDILFGKMGL